MSLDSYAELMLHKADYVFGNLVKGFLALCLCGFLARGSRKMLCLTGVLVGADGNPPGFSQSLG